MSIHREAIEQIYRMAKKFKGYEHRGISQVGEIYDAEKLNRKKQDRQE